MKNKDIRKVFKPNSLTGSNYKFKSNHKNMENTESKKQLKSNTDLRYYKKYIQRNRGHQR